MKLKDCLEEPLNDIEISKKTSHAINHVINTMLGTDKIFYDIFESYDVGLNYVLQVNNYIFYRDSLYNYFETVVKESKNIFYDYNEALEFCKKNNKKVYLSLDSDYNETIKLGKKIGIKLVGYEEYIRIDNLNNEQLKTLFEEMGESFYDL
jgi:hypothetical protein